MTGTDFAQKLHLRATAINLAHCCAAAVTVSSGAANHKNHGWSTEGLSGCSSIHSHKSNYRHYGSYSQSFGL